MAGCGVLGAGGGGLSVAGPQTGLKIRDGKAEKDPECHIKEGWGRAGVDEFEPCLKEAARGLGMETHGTQRVHRTGCSCSWVPPVQPTIPWAEPKASSIHIT